MLVITRHVSLVLKDLSGVQFHKWIIQLWVKFQLMEIASIVIPPPMFMFTIVIPPRFISTCLYPCCSPRITCMHIVSGSETPRVRRGLMVLDTTKEWKAMMDGYFIGNIESGIVRKDVQKDQIGNAKRKALVAKIVVARILGGRIHCFIHNQLHL